MVETSTKKIFFNIDSISLINFFFCLFPISLIFGNLITNINIVLFCCIGLFHLKSKVFSAKNDFYIKIIFLFFLFVLISTFFSFIKSFLFDTYVPSDLERLTKSLLFFRFFILLIVIYLLNKFDILNFKYFIITCSALTIFVSFDVVYQYIFTIDIFGNKSLGRFNPGIFGEELIAGGFIQRFCFFAVLFVIYLFENKNKIQFSLTTFVLCLLGLGIIFSGNRMPFILFLFGLLIIFLFNDKLKKIIPISIIALFILFNLITNNKSSTALGGFKQIYFNFYNQSKIIMIGMKENFLDNLNSKIESEDESKEEKEEEYSSNTLSTKLSLLVGDSPGNSPHLRLFLSAIDTWKKNKIFGNGIKSFRYDCWKLEASDVNLEEDYAASNRKNRLCASHPHNYYLEILTEVGIVGLFFIFVILIKFTIFIINNYSSLKKKSLGNYIFLASIISLMLEMLPIRSTGSFFTTGNTTYIVLMLSIALSYKKLLDIKI